MSGQKIISGLKQAAAIEAALSDLMRQAQEPRGNAPYVDKDEGPKDVVIDGNVDLVSMITAALAAIYPLE